MLSETSQRTKINGSFVILMAKASSKDKKAVEPFFSHDIGTRQNGSIIKLLMELGWEGYGLWWAIVEYMHRNEFPVTDESVVAYELRSNNAIIHKIMNNYDLFKIENGLYISDRILRNLDYRETKSEQSQEAANIRWLLVAFNKAYEREFGERPVLSTEEVEALKRYDNKIDDFRNKLPDIIYTLKGLKFETDINFKPCANWLLAKNNLARLVHGEFGKLKHRKTEKEIQEEQKKKEQEEKERNHSDFSEQLEKICNKIDALDLVSNYVTKQSGRLFIMPPLKKLMEKFDITEKEVEEHINNA